MKRELSGRRFVALLVVCIIASFLAPTLAQARPRIFASFESESEISALKASAGVRVSASTRYPLHNDQSLEVVFPGSGGSVTFQNVPADWVMRDDPSPSRGTPWKDEVLLLFVWSMQPAELTLVLSDSAGGSSSETVALRTGANHVQIRLERTAIDLRHMQAFSLSSKREGAFYFDYFALDRFHPVLETKGRWDADYTTEIETPHVPWGRPLAGGPISVFTIGNARGAGRGIVELAERLQLNFRVTTLERSGFDFGDFYFHRRGGPSLSNTYLADDLLHGPHYDVILWPSLRPWESYPLEVRRKIRERVENGAGLILFDPRADAKNGRDLWEISPLVRPAQVTRNQDRSKWRATKEHYITRGVPLEAFPWGHVSARAFEPAGEVLLESESGTPVLAVRTLGKGRVAAFSYREMGMIPAIDRTWETDLHYPYQDYLWSLVARAAVWAAGREPQAKVEALERKGDRVLVRLADAPQGARLEAAVKNDFGETEGEIKVEAGAGGGRASLPLPARLSGGRLFTDVRLLSENGSLDWATLTLEEKPKATIAAITPSTGAFKVGDRVTGNIKLSGDAECDLTIRLYDNHDRLLGEQSSTVRVQREVDVPFSLDSTGGLTHLARIDCEIKSGGLRQDRRIREIFLKKPPEPWDDYQVIMYSGSNPLPGLWPTVDRQLQRFFVNALCWYPLDFVNHANYSVQASVRVSGTESPDGAARNYYNAMKKKYAATRDKMSLVREHCLNDPAYYELLRKEIRGFVRPWVHLSPFTYFVYEEPSFTCYGDALDICFGDHCMRAMRKWLNEEYGSLEAVNRKWGTDFTRWEDVVPDDTYEAQARGNYASWADHRTFMDISLARSYAFIGEELRKYDPNAMQLLSGTQSGVHSGQDYSRLDPLLGYIDAGAERMHRNFNPKIKLSANARVGAPGRQAIHDIYSSLFNGSSDGAFLFWQYSMLNPDYTLNLTSRETIEALREMREEGIAKLVGSTALDNYGIAVHYSYPSMRGSWIVDGVIREQVSYNTSRTYSRFRRNRQGWLDVLTDAGLQFDHVAYGAVEKGELIAKGYRALVLPMSIALSEKEVLAIKAFVGQGGILIADALAGVMDERCTFRESRVLSDVFGIEAAPASRETIVAMAGEPGLKLTSAKALLIEGGRPILLENRHGKGRAYLLDYFLDNYPVERLAGRREEALRKVGKVLAAAGIHAKIRLTTLSGEPVTGVETYLFQDGSTRLLGLIPDRYMPRSRRLRVSFDGAAAVYDVRSKRFVGRGDSFDIEIEPAVPRLFALLGGRISGMDLRAPSKARLGEEVRIDFRVRGAKDQRSVAKVVVTDPAGRRPRYYIGNREIVNGAGSTGFRTALNDGKGLWSVEVTEVMSGETARAFIDIQ